MANQFEWVGSVGQLKEVIAKHPDDMRICINCECSMDFGFHVRESENLFYTLELGKKSYMEEND